jgi:CRISPR-associated endonuclease/helicase Cas3
MIKNETFQDQLSEYKKARQFSQPLTITTVDQLFKFVFKQEGFEPVLATLAYSKVIIDEIQMYSPEIAACIIMGIKYITESGGKFSILTATFPKVLEYFLKELGIEYRYKEFILNRKRHKIRLLEKDILDEVDEIVEKGKRSKVLVIVNTVRKAQEIYESLGNIENKHLLHSRFIKRDRIKLETEIMEFSDSSDSGIWVTTQVVEASLDIDFDLLFTELSTADGLFQRMGRCYRKRELKKNQEQPNIYIFFKRPSGIGSIIDKEIFQLSKEALLPFNNKIMSEKDKLAVVEDVFSLEKIKKTDYYRGIQSRLDLLAYTPAYEFQYSEVEEKFRNISSYTCIPQCIYNLEKERIHQIISDISGLGFSAHDKVKRVKLLEEINSLTVEVPVYFKEHIVDHIILDRKNAVKLINMEYNNEVGLKMRKKESNIL